MAERAAPPAGLARRSPGALLRREDAAATVAFVLWMPIFIAMVTAVTDVTLVYAFRANVERAALDTVHAMSRGEVAPVDAEGYLRERILMGDAGGVAVEATLAGTARIVVRRTRSAYAYSLFERIAVSGEDLVLARAEMMAEPG
ncbi:MAG: hypothetical protein R6V44_07750 [Paracoccaceae bacterium]